MSSHQKFLKREIFISKINIFKLSIISGLYFIPMLGSKIRPYLKYIMKNEKSRLGELTIGLNKELVGATNFSILFFFRGLFLKKL